MVGKDSEEEFVLVCGFRVKDRKKKSGFECKERVSWSVCCVWV